MLFRSSAHEVGWASVGRSQDTVRRAESVGLADAGDLRELARWSDVVVSVCPSAAVDVAGQVARIRPDGLLYIDANSVAPETVRRIAGMFSPGVAVDAA